MKKKMLIMVLSCFTIFSLLGTGIIVSADEPILSPTIVNLHRERHDLPTQFYKAKGVGTYLQKDKEDNIIGEFYDFRGYFEILDNRKIILDMHRTVPIDEGGYVIDYGGFDLDIPGEYKITLTYEGLSSVESNSIMVEVIEEDITPPEIYLPNYNFNITKTEEQFLRELERYLNRTRVYDSADGIIKITIDNFSKENIDEIRNAKLKEIVEITLIISDEAGNEVTKKANLTISDVLNPTILNIKTLITKKNKPISITSHLEFFDNYTEPEDIERTYTFYGTLVNKNQWEKSGTRINESKGELIRNYVRINNIDDLLEDVKTNQKRGYNIGDYYEVSLDGVDHYIYIKNKVQDEENPNMKNNLWTQTTNFKEVKGKAIEIYNNLVHGDGDDFISWLNNNEEDSYEINDYFKVRDVLDKENYYIYISNKQRDFRDEQTSIDFSKAGVQYVVVTATDEANNKSTADFRVVIENSISLITIVLITNGILLAVVGIFIVFIYVIPNLNKKKNRKL